MIISSTVGEAHEKIISYILRYGEYVVNEAVDYYKRVYELHDMKAPDISSVDLIASNVEKTE